MSATPNLIGVLCSELLRIDDATDDGKYDLLCSKDRETCDAVEDHIKQIISHDTGDAPVSYESKIIPVVKAVAKRLFYESNSMEE